MHLGTSGFAYEPWKGPFYPHDLPARRMLAFYSTRFDSVELNYTFRREPSEKAVIAWREETPPAFVFSLKAPQRITHLARLRPRGDAVPSFLARARLLREKLGPVLFQLPPTLPAGLALLESFLDGLPSGLRYAFEFRHPSWEDARPLLAARDVAWCVAETDEAPFLGDSLQGGPFVYLRLRKTDYTDEESHAWARRISSALSEGADVYCYIKHEDSAAGVDIAERLGRHVAGLAADHAAGSPRALRKRRPSFERPASSPPRPSSSPQRMPSGPP